MHKKLKHLIKNLKDVFDVDEINKIAKETKFVQRKSNITAKDFLTLNVFHGADICSTPLSQLASRYDVLFDTQVSKQAIDKRFNKNSVKFLGTKNDTEYLKTMGKDKELKDLKLADLGYFKIEYLKEITRKGSSFISKVKSNTSLYMKNPNPEKTKLGDIKKCSEYIKIDVIELINPLVEGETIELSDIYIGSKKELKNRLIMIKRTYFYMD